MAVLAASLAACGGGGSDVSDLGPFWVATDIAAADLDNDGRTDVVSVAMLANSGTQNQGYLRVYRQTSSWGFAFSQYLVGTYPWRVKIADIDGDAAADLLILDVGRSGASPGMVWLMRQDRRNRGVFLAPEVVAAGLPSTYDFAVIDADLDGAPDIVLASGIGGSDGAALLLQDPSQRGTFRPATLITFPGKPQAVGMGDLNGDGLPDLAFYATTSFSVDTGSTGHFAIVHAQKSGGFGPPTVLFPQIGVNAQLMQVGDANGDGRPDVLSVFTPFSTNFAAKLTVAVQNAPGVLRRSRHGTQPDTRARWFRRGRPESRPNGRCGDDRVLPDWLADGRPCTDQRAPSDRRRRVRHRGNLRDADYNGEHHRGRS